MRPRATGRALAFAACCGLILIASAARATMPPSSGPIAPPIAAAFERGLFALPEPAVGPGVSAASAVWRIPIIRVAFTDSAIVYPAGVLERALFDTLGAMPTGSLAEYYDWASEGRLRVRGEVVATVRVPHDRNYYAFDSWGVYTSGTPNNSYGLFRDAVNACDGAVDFSRFDSDFDGYVDMLWIVHAGPGGENTGNPRDLWSITSRGTASWNNGGPAETNDLMPGSLTLHTRIDRFTILPELSAFHPGSPSEIGVYCHEFGHALGLPDLYDTSVLGGSANSGPGNWSLMSTGAYGGDGQSPESPAHLSAWCRSWLGWTQRVSPSEDTTLVLPPAGEGGPVVEMSFQGESSPEHLLIENRARQRFDGHLAGEGLLVQRVDESVIGALISSNRVNAGLQPGVKVLEADGRDDLTQGFNHGDPSDPFPGVLRRTRADDFTTPSLRTYRGAPTNLALENIERVGRDVRVRVRVRAAGWGTATTLDPAAPEPQLSFSASPHAIVLRSGAMSRADAEPVGGRNAVVVRDRAWGGSWRAPVVVDRGTNESRDPCLARLGAEDAVLVWLESTATGDALCYRARVQGRWGATTVLAAAPQGASTPSIAVDARGRVFVSWIESLEGFSRLRFMNFLWSAPYGQAQVVTTPEDLPSAPFLTANGDGHAYLLWPDRGGGRSLIRAARFHPDSGLSAPFPLVPSSLAAQLAVAAVLDTAGVLHSVWQQLPGAGGEIHYQRRAPTIARTLRDTTLDALGLGLGGPRIALDATGGLHVAYERTVTTGSEVRYKRFTPGVGWDSRGTQVSDATDLSVAALDVLPTSQGNVTVTWLGSDTQSQRLRSRDRRLDGNLLLEAPAPAPPRDVALTFARNPVRAGAELSLRGPGIVPGAELRLLDAAGREVARTRAEQAGRVSFSSASTAALPPGLYFARVSGRAETGRVVVLR